MIKLKQLITEGPLVSGWVWVNGWAKAIKLLKSSGGWSPHMRRKDIGDPVGTTNSDFNSKIPDKYDGKNIMGFHRQAMNSAFISGGDWRKIMYLNWTGDAKAMVKILKKAGFKKVTWTKGEKIAVHPKGTKPKDAKAAGIVPAGY